MFRTCQRELRSTSRSYARSVQLGTAHPPAPEEYPVNTTLMRTRVLVVVLGLALLLAACGSSSKSGSGSVTLNGSGSTFQKTFDDAVVTEFAKSNSDITV